MLMVPALKCAVKGWALIVYIKNNLQSLSKHLGSAMIFMHNPQPTMEKKSHQKAKVKKSNFHAPYLRYSI